MAEIITLELPESLVQQAKEIAMLTHRRVEEVLIEWLNRASTDLPLESLSDGQILALCDLRMQPEQQAQLSDLLSRNQEGTLNDVEVNQLDELMQIYRRGLVRKAKALKVAVERGLRPALSSV
jgi:hypothetical protein